MGFLIFLCVCAVLQDKAQPETQATSFGDVSFKATLAQDTPGALSLIRQPGTDGFTLSSSPLFQVCIILRYKMFIYGGPKLKKQKQKNNK